MAVNRPNQVVENGLIFSVDAFNHKSFDSGSAPNDILNMIDTSITGSRKLSTSYAENAWEFDGTDDYIDFGDPDLFDQAFQELTVTVWCNPDTISAGTMGMVTKWDNGSFTDQFGLFANNDSITWAVNGGGGESGLTTNAIPLVVGKWQYVCGTWNIDQTLNVYVNGVFSDTGTQTTTGYNNPSTTTFHLGAQVNGVYRPFNGKIARAQIYNRVLTAQEIKQNYDATKWRFQ